MQHQMVFKSIFFKTNYKERVTHSVNLHALYYSAIRLYVVLVLSVQIGMGFSGHFLRKYRVHFRFPLQFLDFSSVLCNSLKFQPLRNNLSLKN